MNSDAPFSDFAPLLQSTLDDPWRLLAFALAAILLLALIVTRRHLRAARLELSSLCALPEEMAALRTELVEREATARRVPGLEQDLAELREAHTAEVARRSGLERQLESESASHAARLEELRNMKKELEDRFQVLASGILKQNSETFLGLVSERFEKHSAGAREDLERRQQAIRALVEPLDKKLGRFDDRIGEIEKARAQAYAQISEQVKMLGEGGRALELETRKLVQALRAPKTRGRWGEMQLKQVFEMAGMAAHVDYVTEHQIDTEAGKRRPDAVVRIPGGKTIVVDAKTPLEGYLDSLEAETPEAQGLQLKRHARQVREHVRLLSSKAYQDAIETTPDFVVMFIPGETFVAAAAEADPGLIEYAFENRVLIATPTTLMALVKAIAYGWQQDKMARNAVEVQRLARELYERLSTFADHLGKLGRSLNGTVTAYNSAVGSLEGRILPAARKFEQLGVVPPQAEIAAATSVEAEPRPLTAPEFTATPSTGA
jgi:DNA recombination protein RmuC